MKWYDRLSLTAIKTDFLVILFIYLLLIPNKRIYVSRHIIFTIYHAILVTHESCRMIFCYQLFEIDFTAVRKLILLSKVICST